MTARRGLAVIARSRARRGDVAIPDGRCCGWGDVVAAVEAAVAALGQRFGPVGLVGAVTPAQVMVAVTGGRLLAPDWPTMR